MKPCEYLRLPNKNAQIVSRLQVTGQSSEKLHYLRVRKKMKKKLRKGSLGHRKKTKREGIWKRKWIHSVELCQEVNSGT